LVAPNRLRRLFCLLFTIVGFFVFLRLHMCRRCVNLSCPLNNVPDDLKAAYLERNPHLVAAG
jgi:hypothetical protein